MDQHRRRTWSPQRQFRFGLVDPSRRTSASWTGTGISPHHVSGHTRMQTNSSTSYLLALRTKTIHPRHVQRPLKGQFATGSLPSSPRLSSRITGGPLHSKRQVIFRPFSQVVEFCNDSSLTSVTGPWLHRWMQGANNFGSTLETTFVFCAVHRPSVR